MENMPLRSRLKHAWNAFFSREPTDEYKYPTFSEISYRRPDRTTLNRGNDRTIVTAILNRIAMDCAAINITHARLDEDGRYLETIDSGLNNCLNLEANLDQTGRAFLQDAYLTMLDEGCCVIVPTDTTRDPFNTESYDIEEMRVGKVTSWMPDRVRVLVYNEHTGRREEIVLPKTMVSIVENPFYAVMNEPNSIFQRLIRKLNLLDVIDEETSSGKMNLIIQLPYIAKTDLKRKQAEARTQFLEKQLETSKYGIGYIDGTEKVIQLNRSLDNNLMAQIEYLTKLAYSQLGLTQEVMDGSANEETMLNYYSRTTEPIVSALVDSMKRTFLTKTARSQRQSILFFRDPFKLAPVSQIAEIADKFTRNEIMTSNEIRQVVGMKPSDDPDADRLKNANISESKEEIMAKPENQGKVKDTGEEIQNGKKV